MCGRLGRSPGRLAGAAWAGGCRRLPGNKIPADPHDLHDVEAFDPLEVGRVDLGVYRDDGGKAEVKVEAIVELSGAGEVAALGAGRLHLVGVGLGKGLGCDLVGVIGELCVALVVDLQGVFKREGVFHGCDSFHRKRNAAPRRGGASCYSRLRMSLQ